ncbi:serine hydrolase [Tenacibaculum sp.]|nr:serine hydrolase [Tenacibaculum sp.]
MKKKIITFSILIIGVLIIWGAFMVFKDEPKTIKGLMESYVNPGVKIKIRSPFSGVVLVAKGDKVIFEEGYGEADRTKKQLNTIESKFGIGSITKQFTAMLIMQLVEKGTIKLTDTIGDYLPYLSKKKGNNITIHQLLSHTSGLPHYDGLQKIGVNLKEFARTSYTPEALAKLIDKTILLSKPGTRFTYSSLGYDLLGVILEEVSRMSFSELLNNLIIIPLGLKNTGFGTNEFVKSKIVKGYRYKEVYGLDWWTSEHGGKITEAAFRDQSTAYSAGGMHSTVRDLFIWSKAIKSNKLLSSKFTKIMMTPHKKGYCYGWVRNWDDIIEKNINVRLHGHGGALAGNSAYIALYDDETTIIYLSNRSNLKAEEILHQIHLRANNLKDEHKLKGYPNRSSFIKFKEAGGMTALQDYFNRLSRYSGYKVNPSNSTMRGVMKIHLEAKNIKVADSLKTIFLKTSDENSINEFGYYFLNSETPEYALDFFKENVKNFPKSSNSWDSLGEAYFIYKEYNKAINCYKQAIKLGEKVSHKSLRLYRENLKSVLDETNK